MTGHLTWDLVIGLLGMTLGVFLFGSVLIGAWKR